MDIGSYGLGIGKLWQLKNLNFIRRCGLAVMNCGAVWSQYKDYVLVLLFVKYVSDKYAGQPYAEITVPEGASFQDMVVLKGYKEIGDRLNKQIIQPLAEANE